MAGPGSEKRAWLSPTLESGVAMSEELAKIAQALESLCGFMKQLFGPSVEQVGEIGGDWARYWRLRNLLAIKTRVDRIVEAEGIGSGDLRHLSLSVGLPMLEKASYQDDSFLQEKWANLIVGSLRPGDPEEDFSLEITYVEILGQFSRLDCEVLEYVCEEGVMPTDQGRFKYRELNPDDVMSKFHGRLTHISLEKLNTLGVVRRQLKVPLQSGTGPSGLAEVIVPTSMGINLIIAASGEVPRWFAQSPSKGGEGTTQ